MVRSRSEQRRDLRQEPANPPKLQESLAKIRSVIADMAQSRERVQEQMNVLAQQQAKLQRQADQRGVLGVKTWRGKL